MTVDIWCGQMSRAAAMKASAAFLQFTETISTDANLIQFELDFILCHYAPCRVTVDAVAVQDGETIDIDGQPVRFSFPISRADFAALPVDLCKAWAVAALERNVWFDEYVQSFTQALTKQYQITAQEFVNAQSQEPMIATN